MLDAFARDRRLAQDSMMKQGGPSGALHDDRSRPWRTGAPSSRRASLLGLPAVQPAKETRRAEARPRGRAAAGRAAVRRCGPCPVVTARHWRR